MRRASAGTITPRLSTRDIPWNDGFCAHLDGCAVSDHVRVGSLERAEAPNGPLRSALGQISDYTVEATTLMIAAASTAAPVAMEMTDATASSPTGRL